MPSLNYHHLLYFWTVAREGSLVKAAEALNLSHPTISGQLKQLEESLGEPLFDRSRRRLQLTEAGRVAYHYADEIFSLGREFVEVLKGHASDRRMPLNVGVADALPKLVAKALIEPALEGEGRLLLRCHEDAHERLLAQLALHNLDVVLSDAPVPPGSAIRAYNHPLGECGVTFFAAPDTARRLRGSFPRSLEGEPFLAPMFGTSLRRNLDGWLSKQELRPDIVGEFADTALLKVFAADGLGVFCAASVVEAEIAGQYGVEIIGHAEDLRERFYAISVERKVRHPAVAALCESARRDMFPN
jgi:LysR family transcriptional activator of nhaA